jgi:rhamnogalacturonyl hydrolase YesR
VLFAVGSLLMAVSASPAEAADAPDADSPRVVGQRASAWSVANQMDSLSYQNVCTAYGILKVARATGDDELRKQIESRFRRYLLEGADPKRDNARVPQHQWFGFLPLELYRQTKDPRYLQRGVELAEEQYAGADAAGMPGYTPRWYVDDIYGATTMQSLAYACTGDEKYLERAVRQVLAYVQKLQQTGGLFHHGPESRFFWGRGNGWCAAAFAELLGVMPVSHPQREAVLAAHRRMMEALRAHQTEQGLWRQLVEDSQSWPETSSTGMFLFAWAEGVQNGWLPKATYAPAIERAWTALASCVDETGRLRDVCVGTGHGKTRQFYLDRPRATGDAHGQAALLWAAASLIEPRDRATDAKRPEPAPQRQPTGTAFVPADVDWDHPAYQTGFDDPDVLQDWKLEGGLRMSVADGNLVLQSAPGSTQSEPNADHLVCWLTREMPADFLLEFTVRPENRKQGLNIVFFNARGRRGESIFDPAIAPRDGLFKQYHSGDLNCYHVSYWAAGRGTANLRKNHGFHLVAEGKDLVTDGAAGAFQTVRVYKRGGMIRCTVDDVISLAYDDDGTTFGPVWTHSGWIGLRQMGHTVRCEYGHVKVWPLKPDR